MKNEDFKEMVHALAERLIKEMRRESEERGAKFLVVTKVRQLEKACREAGIMVLDVEDPLSNPSLLLRIGGHMNEAGNGVLAWELAKSLKEKSLVPRSHLKD